ncbi:MAG: hypothetical protein J0L92_26270 [Deltaproteobacteria bacterium]|nr:hypothetical protein [Deltaproteobacteria bacterium]
MTSEGMEARYAGGKTVLVNTTTPARTPIFLIDATLAAGMGSMLLALAPWLRDQAGGGLSVDALRLVGLFLLPWAAHNAFAGSDLRARMPHALVQVAGDLLWVVLSLGLCLHHWPALSALGRVLYASQTAVVALVLITKLHVVSHARRTPVPART